MKDLYIGIDLGTSAMKLILIDSEENVLAGTSVDYPLIKPQEGWSEVNQECWFDSMMQGLKSLLDGQNTKALRCIGITGQMHTLVVLDREGRFIRPALMWNDLRTRELVPRLQKTLKGFEEGEYLSRTVSTGSPLSNLYWLKENEPENYSRIGMFMIGPDYLVYRLTGVHGTDYCEASTSCLYEIRNRRWSPQAARLLELNEEVYPAVRGSAVPAGYVSKETAHILGIPENVRVLTGTGDNAAAAVSTRCMDNDQPFISLGTSGVLVLPVDEEWEQPYGKRILFSYDGSRFYNLVQGSVQANGPTVNWWNSRILQNPDLSYIDNCIDLEKQKSNRVLFYPHLDGEKTLYADSTLRGAFIGMSTDTDRETLTYAMLEGICFAFRELAQKLGLSFEKYRKIQVVGGGTNSRVWLQTLANVLNIPVERIDGKIGAAYGIAHLAVMSENESGDHSRASASESTANGALFYPDPEMSRLCGQKYEMYRRLHDGLKYITEGRRPD